MRKHDWRQSDDGSECAECGMRVRYFRDHRTRLMDYVAVVMAARVRFIELGGEAGEERAQEAAQDCDVVRRAAALSVVRD